jgi:hypothetical protein
MTSERFIEIMEECYAPYPSMLKGMVKNFLERKPDYYRAILSKVILETHSTKYKTAPGIADFSDAEKAVWAILEDQEMRKPLQIEAPAEKSHEGIEFLSLLTSRMSKGLHPTNCPEVQEMLKRIESTYK